MTDALCDFIKSQADRPIKHVYDLLSESIYKKVVNWDRVSSSGAKVYHHIFKGGAGLDLLPKIATILGKQLSWFLPGQEQFRRGQWYHLQCHDRSVPEFGFEFPLGSDPQATREGEMEEARELLFGT